MELRELRESKKGSIQDIFTLIIFLVGLGIFIVVLAYTIPKVTDGLRETQLNDSAEVREALLNSDTMVTSRLDNVYLIMFAGLIISILIASFMIESHPVFIPIYIFLFAFAVIIGVIMNNVYDEFLTASELNVTASTQTIQTAIMGNFIPIIIGVGVLSMIIIFGKKRYGEGRI